MNLSHFNIQNAEAKLRACTTKGRHSMFDIHDSEQQQYNVSASIFKLMKFLFEHFQDIHFLFGEVSPSSAG